MREYIYSVDDIIKNNCHRLDGLDEVKKIDVDTKIYDVRGYDIIYYEKAVLIRFFSKKEYTKRDMIGYLFLSNKEDLIIRDGKIIVEGGINKPHG